MPPTDPSRLLRLIHRVTAGSLVAAVVGAGAVTVHLAGHHTRKLASAAPAGVSATGPTAAGLPTGTPTTRSRAATRRAASRSRRPTTAKRTFRSVAPVQPSAKQPQATSTGS
jgi:hypothetical protein